MIILEKFASLVVYKWSKNEYNWNTGTYIFGGFLAWSIEGHNSDVFYAIWLLIKCGQDLTHINILCKFSEEIQWKLIELESGQKKVKIFVLIIIC